MTGELLAMLRDLVFQFGGLLVWPVARVAEREQLRRNQVLRAIFTIHIAAACLVLAAIVLRAVLAAGWSFASFMLLRRVGLASLAGSALTFAVMRREELPEEDDED